MPFNLKNHMTEISFIIGAIILFYLTLPFQISLIVFCLTLATLGLLAVIGLSGEMEVEEAPVTLIINDDSKFEYYPYED